MAHPGPVAILYLHDVKSQQKRLWSRITQLEQSDYSSCVAKLEKIEHQILTEQTVDLIVDAKVKPLLEAHGSLHSENASLKVKITNLEKKAQSLMTAVEASEQKHSLVLQRTNRVEELVKDCETALDTFAERLKNLENSYKQDKAAIEDFKDNADFDIGEHSTAIKNHRAHLSQIDIQIKAFHSILKAQKDDLLGQMKRSTNDRRKERSSRVHQVPDTSSTHQRKTHGMSEFIEMSCVLSQNAVPPMTRANTCTDENTLAQASPGLQTPALLSVKLDKTGRTESQATTLVTNPSIGCVAEDTIVPTQLLVNRPFSKIQSSDKMLLATQPYSTYLTPRSMDLMESVSTSQAETLPLQQNLTPAKEAGKHATIRIRDLSTSQAKEQECPLALSPCRNTRSRRSVQEAEVAINNNARRSSRVSGVKTPVRMSPPSVATHTGPVTRSHGRETRKRPAEQINKAPPAKRRPSGR